MHPGSACDPLQHAISPLNAVQESDRTTIGTRRFEKCPALPRLTLAGCGEATRCCLGAAAGGGLGAAATGVGAAAAGLLRWAALPASCTPSATGPGPCEDLWLLLPRLAWEGTLGSMGGARGDAGCFSAGTCRRDNSRVLT